MDGGVGFSGKGSDRYYILCSIEGEIITTMHGSYMVSDNTCMSVLTIHHNYKRTQFMSKHGSIEFAG